MPFHLLPSARPDLPRSLPTGDPAAFPAYGPLRACAVCFCDFLNAQTHDQGADGQGERAGGNMKCSTATGKAKKAPPKDVSPRPALPSICVCPSPSLALPLPPSASPPPPRSPPSCCLALLSPSPALVAMCVSTSQHLSLPPLSVTRTHTRSCCLTPTHPPTHSFCPSLPSLLSPDTTGRHSNS